MWNMATWYLRDAVNLSSRAVPPTVDEFEFAGVEKGECVEAPAARVASSPCHFECRYVQTVRLPGRSDISWVDLVIGIVEHVHLADEMVTAEGKLDVLRMRPIARLGYYDFTVVDNVFEMVAPEASDAELAGLEGTALPPNEREPYGPVTG